MGLKSFIETTIIDLTFIKRIIIFRAINEEKQIKEKLRLNIESLIKAEWVYNKLKGIFPILFCLFVLELGQKDIC